MNKNFMFYRCFLEREMAAEGEPGLLAATEVVQAVCDAGFQRNGLSMKCYPSSPHCYYKYAKLPKDGMYMLWAVKKNVTKGTSETTYSPHDTCTRAQIVTFLYRGKDL